MLSLPAANGPLGDFDGSALPIPNARISALSLEHHDLDSVIDALAGAPTRDDLMVARLKKRRLQIRDEIAGILAAAQTAPGEAAFQDAAYPDTSAMQARTMAAAPRPASSGLGFGVVVTLLTLLMLVLGWSGIADSLNQTMAQIYVLSLLAAANG